MSVWRHWSTIHKTAKETIIYVVIAAETRTRKQLECNTVSLEWPEWFWKLKLKLKKQIFELFKSKNITWFFRINYTDLLPFCEFNIFNTPCCNISGYCRSMLVLTSIPTIQKKICLLVSNHANIHIQCGKYTLMVNVQLLRQTNILQSTR